MIIATTPQKITTNGYGTVFPLLANAQLPIAQTTQTTTQMIASLNSNPIAPPGNEIEVKVRSVLMFSPYSILPLFLFLRCEQGLALNFGHSPESVFHELTEVPTPLSLV